MALGSFPVKLEHRVAWGEMDAFGHVNNANYLRWFESARIAYFEKVAVSVGAQDKSPWIPILGRATVDFRKPVSYPDTVTVEASVVLLDPATGAKTPIPAELRAAIERLEG